MRPLSILLALAFVAPSIALGARKSKRAHKRSGGAAKNTKKEVASCRRRPTPKAAKR